VVIVAIMAHRRRRVTQHDRTTSWSSPGWGGIPADRKLLPQRQQFAAA